MRRRTRLAAGAGILCGAVAGFAALGSGSAPETAVAEVMTPGFMQDIVCCSTGSGCIAYTGSCPQGSTPRPCPCTPPY